MSFISDTLSRLCAFLGSGRLIAAVALPMLIWLVVLVTVLRLSPETAVSGRAFQLYYILLSLCITVRSLSRLKPRGYGAALALAGVMSLLLAGVLWYGFRFSGTAELGVGEAFREYQAAERGSWRAIKQLPLALATAPAQNYGKAVLILEGKRRELPLNGTMRWRGHSLKLAGESVAPLFLVDNAIGDENYAGYLKLAIGREKPRYFQFGTLPHRFYISYPEKAGEVKSGVTPDILHLRVVRGKLNVLRKDVKRGESVEFEGHTVRFEEGAPWVRVEVKDMRPLYLFYAGALLIVAGVLLQAGERRKVTGATV